MFSEAKGDPFSGQYNFTPREKLDQAGTFVRVERSVAAWTFESLTSFEYVDRVAGLDLDATPGSGSQRVVDDTSWQILQDLRVGWTSGERLELELGLFLLHADLEASNFLTGGRGLLGQVFDERTDYLGLFGRARLELSERFSVDLGIRLNVERKDFYVEAQNFRFTGGMLVPISEPGVGILRANVESLDIVPTGDIVLSYHAASDVDFYMKFVRGYKGRHFNAGETTDATPVNPANPEFVNSLEFGWDASLLSGIVSWRAAAFLYLSYLYLLDRLVEETAPGEIPDWLKVLSIPVSLALVTVRFTGRSVGALLTGLWGLQPDSTTEAT